MKYIELGDNFVQWENGNISHRPLLKIIINPVLRFIQFWSDEPLVIGSICTLDNSENVGIIKPEFHGYSLARIKHTEKHNDYS